MTKQPKEFKSLPSSGSSFGTSGEWKDTWKKMAAENETMISKNMLDSGILSSPWLDKKLFNPEDVTKVFTQTMQQMSDQSKSEQVTKSSRLVDVQAFLHSTLDRFQRKAMTKGKGKSQKDQFHSVEEDENPFFFLLQQSYVLNVQFLKEATSCIGELDPPITGKLTSYTRNLVNALSLATFPLKHDVQEILTSGIVSESSSDDMPPHHYKIPKGPMEPFQLGKNLSATPGKVVFQNDLFQLIQYEPSTGQVAKRPLFIVPPWTNKYYIFDLSVENSFVRWALESGLTVFVMSWVNPDERKAQMNLSDYILKGVKVGLDKVCKITKEKSVNVVGYCVGGTILASLMAYLKGKNDSPIASATFLATPFDFSKTDELGLYRSEHQNKKLKEYVSEKGYLEGQYMVQAFNLLRANDLIWSSEVNHYLLGQAIFPFDMLYWMCDGLRIPTKMHSAYLSEILIENRLMERGKFFIEDVPIDLNKISTPLFVMAAQEDHIAPWRSVYALTQVANSKVRKFVLSSSGHIGGVFNPPNAQKHHYWVGDKLPSDANNWLANAREKPGSWWEEWRLWLEPYNGGLVPARSISKAKIIEDAPGSYATGANE
ncbi:MAG: class I poly(R)-hydroxyalkanoic acid synthase [Alphaproteobacteria bacterium]|jgi:polyhydroxyalkanoate synthase|nr:class I poly(R)-hydroxyalkanoic acid synthase [Alphaproteobacteria bacterium]